MELGKTPSRAPADARAAAQHNVRQRARSVSDSDSRQRKPRRLRRPPGGARIPVDTLPPTRLRGRAMGPPPPPRAGVPAGHENKRPARLDKKPARPRHARGRPDRSAVEDVCRLVWSAPRPRGGASRAAFPLHATARWVQPSTRKQRLKTPLPNSLAVRSTLPTCRGSGQWEDVSAARFGRHALQRLSIGRRCGRGALAARRAGLGRPPSRS